MQSLPPEAFKVTSIQTRTVMNTQNPKDALKQLREQRKPQVERAKKRIREQSKRMKAIRSEIADEGKTVPEIAAALGMPTDQVLLTVSALRKFGEVVEAAKDGDYFQYRMAETKTA